MGIRCRLYKLAVWYIGECNKKWDKPTKDIYALDRLTCRNGTKAYLLYGADCEWQNFSRYDVLDNAIQKLAYLEDKQTKRGDVGMLMTAVQAREKAQNMLTKEAEIQLLEIEKSINDAIEKGKTSCWFYKRLNQQVAAKLHELGYRIKDYSCQRDGIMFEIIWRAR